MLEIAASRNGNAFLTGITILSLVNNSPPRVDVSLTAASGGC